MGDYRALCALTYLEGIDEWKEPQVMDFVIWKNFLFKLTNIWLRFKFARVWEWEVKFACFEVEGWVGTLSVGCIDADDTENWV